MQNYNWKTLVISLVIVLLGCGGCSSIKIINPTKDSQLIVTPYDLKVAHTGCGEVQPETFKAWLFYEATDDTDDITSSFSYSNGQWIASNYPLLLWGYKLSAQADVETGPFCFIRKRKDERDFYVLAPTCIKGNLNWQFIQPDGSVRQGPWAGANLEFYVSKTNPKFSGQFLGKTVSDETGNFCIDRIPVAICIEIRVPKQPAPRDAWGDSCEGMMDNILPTNATATCEESNCNEVGTVKATCYVD